MIKRTQSLPKTRKMQIRTNRSGIPRNNNIRKHNQNGSNKTSWDKGLAISDNSKTNTIISWIWKLLLKIHFQIRRNSTTPSRPNEEKQDMELD